MYIDCSTRLPSIYIMFDGVWLELAGSDLVQDVSVDQDGSMCVASFLPNADDIWIFGHALYNGYYVVHKPDSYEMQFAPNDLL